MHNVNNKKNVSYILRYNFEYLRLIFTRTLYITTSNTIQRSYHSFSTEVQVNKLKKGS